VLGASEQTGICSVQIAARLIWLLQPSDTHVFNSYKTCLVEAYKRLVRVLEGHEVRCETWFQEITLAAANSLSERSWRSTFEENGF
jgi:hypothetical protein